MPKKATPTRPRAASQGKQARKDGPSRAQADTQPGETELLLEVGTEELPSHFVPPALQSLAQAAERLLRDQRLPFGTLRTLGTPRRLVLVVTALAAQQEASTREALGPPKRAAFDDSGAPTKAATGFAASQGVAVEDLEIKHTPKGEYVCAVKREPGLEARTVLETLLPELVGGLTFPKTMRWNETGVRFARPIRWIVALCGGRIVPFQVAGVQAGDRTWGHRFHGSKKATANHGIKVKNLKSYFNEVEAAGVVPDQLRRRDMILSQLQELRDSVGARLNQDDELLEEAIYSVEQPKAILGHFDQRYLSLPDEVLKTAMKEHQGYFPLTSAQGALLDKFISVSNMNLRNMRLIREGNERVLAARLADAGFFFREDRKITLADRVEKLKGVTFHQKLGTMHQKTGRVMALAAKIADQLGDLDLMEIAKRSAQLSKTDLLTGMVGEFPTLQGIVGGEYARLDGEPPAVCAAIAEQYLPRAMEGRPPETAAGKVLSLADRLDSIVAFFHVGIVPTGSEDPFGLRRHATAVVRIAAEGPLRLDLRELLGHAKRNVEMQGFAAAGLARADAEKQRLADPAEFILERVRYYGRLVLGLRDDVMEAVLVRAGEQSLDLVDLLARMNALQAMTRRADFDPLMVGFKRAHRLTEKEQWDSKGIDPAHFQHPSEAELHKHLQEAQTHVPRHLSEGDYAKGLEILVGMKPAIDAFFEGVMVNAEDPALRSNRLSLLQAVDDLFLSFADFSQIVVENR